MKDTIKEIILPLLAVLCIICFFTLVMIVLFHPMPSGNKDMANIFIGVFGTLTGTSINYFFGSSKGSSEKNAILSANQTPADTTPPAPPVIAPVVPPVPGNPLWTLKNYTSGQQVSLIDGKNYLCTVNTTNNQPPTDTNFWRAL